MKINITYDASVSTLSASAQANFKQAVNAAVAYWDHAIANNVTITIDFGWGKAGPNTVQGKFLAENWIYFDAVTYDQMVAALESHQNSAAAVTADATLPATDPTGGGADFVIPYAQQQLLGFQSDVGSRPIDVALNKNDTYDFDPTTRSAPGKYDAVGLFEHEISEVLGRFESLGIDQGSGNYTVMDMFRYSGPGAHSIAYSGGFFSIDGQHMLLPLNDPNNGGDAGDWADSVTGDSFGDTSTGVPGLVSPTDLRVMQVLGYKLAPATPLDFNAGGLTGYLWGNADGSYTQWLMTNVTSAWASKINNLASPGAGWRLVGTGDLTGDLATDLLFQRPDGTLTAQAMFNATTTATYDLGGLAAGWQVAAVGGDFNGNNTADVLVENVAQQQYEVWKTAGTSQATPVDVGGWSDLGYKFAALGDFSGDSRTDVLFSNTDGTYGLWINNGGGASFSVWTGESFGAGWTLVGAADFNGDGQADLLFQSPDDSQLAIWEWNGSTFVSGAPVASPASGGGAAIVGIGSYTGGAHAGLLVRDEAGDLVAYAYNGTAFALGYTITAASGVVAGAGQTLEGFARPIGYDEILFQQAGTTVAAWDMNGTAIVGGGALGAPGGTWALAGKGDFYANGTQDLLFMDGATNVAIWEMAGTAIVGGGAVGQAGGTWRVTGVGDFNGDRHGDILFQDAGHNLALWEMSGTSIIGGGDIGNPGGTWQAVGVGDFDGDGKSDILFRDSGADYAIWEMNGVAVVGGGAIGNPGGTWTAVATGDFNGDGRSDILFQDAAGNLAIWEMNGTSIVGGGAIGNPGGTWHVQGVGDYSADGYTDILFQDAAGDLAIWEMNGTSIIGGGAIGAPGSAWHVFGFG